MKSYLKIALVAATVGLALPAFAAKLPEAERAALHATMLQHIDRQVTNGIYLHMNLKSGAVEQFAPAKAHPMMFSFGDHFVLCTDFKDAEGKSAMVDFYVVKRGKSFAIFQTEINNREPLMKLMEAGKVQSVD